VDQLDLPFAGTVEVKSFQGKELISTSYRGDHHNVTFEDTSIRFQESSDKSRLHVEAFHGEKFTPPYVENWISEALSFATARAINPRMVIRHCKKDALVFIRSTPRDIESRMPPPFFSAPSNREEFWQSFCAYLSKCKSVQQFEPLDLTNGFWELCLASTGTLQGFLISLSVYIEFCVNDIFSSLKSVEVEKNNKENKENVEDLIQHVSAWNGDEAIRDRAKGILSMLNTPSLPERMDILVEQGVITDMQKSIWKKVRPYLAHGNVIDFRKEEKFLHFRNYLISMVYRLIFRIIGYKGLVLDYNGKEFMHIAYDWNDESVH
jgi:hypothetical protein